MERRRQIAGGCRRGEGTKGSANSAAISLRAVSRSEFRIPARETPIAAQEAYLVRSQSAFPQEQMADTNWVFIGSPPFFGEVLAGIPVERELVVEGKGVRNVHPKAGEPSYFLDSHTQGTYSPLGFSEDGEVYAVVTNAPGPAPNSDIRIFESNITSARLGAVQSFTDNALASVITKKLAGASGVLPQYYQVLLRVKYKDSVPVESAYVLHRELHAASYTTKK